MMYENKVLKAYLQLTIHPNLSTHYFLLLHLLFHKFYKSPVYFKCGSICTIAHNVKTEPRACLY